MNESPIRSFKPEPYQTLVDTLCSSPGLDRQEAEQATDAVLCVLDQALFYDGRYAWKHPPLLRRLLKRCRHHRGSSPRRLSKTGFLSTVASDLHRPHPLPEIERIIREILAGLRAQLSDEENESVRRLLPREWVDLWPSERSTARTMGRYELNS